jgi:ketopantoate reductase
MLQDVEAGRKTEIGVISGAVVAAAADHCIDVPLTKAMLILVEGLEEGAELK